MMERTGAGALGPGLRAAVVVVQRARRDRAAARCKMAM